MKFYQKLYCKIKIKTHRHLEAVIISIMQSLPTDRPQRERKYVLYCAINKINIPIPRF